jgi:hypothetical protein
LKGTEGLYLSTLVTVFIKQFWSSYKGCKCFPS